MVHSGPDRGSPQPGGELSFATRTGTRLGIETHVFRAETCKDLSMWTRHIVAGCHTAAEMIKEVTTSKYGLKGGRFVPYGLGESAKIALLIPALLRFFIPEKQVPVYSA